MVRLQKHSPVVIRTVGSPIFNWGRLNLLLLNSLNWTHYTDEAAIQFAQAEKLYYETALITVDNKAESGASDSNIDSTSANVSNIVQAMFTPIFKIMWP